MNEWIKLRMLKVIFYKVWINGCILNDIVSSNLSPCAWTMPVREKENWNDMIFTWEKKRASCFLLPASSRKRWFIACLKCTLAVPAVPNRWHLVLRCIFVDDFMKVCAPGTHRTCFMKQEFQSIRQLCRSHYSTHLTVQPSRAPWPNPLLEQVLQLSATNNDLNRLFDRIRTLHQELW